MIISPNSTEESHDSSGMSCDLLGLGTLQLEDPLGYAWWILGHVNLYNVQGEIDEPFRWGKRRETNESEGKEARERGKEREGGREREREGERGVCFIVAIVHTLYMHFTESVSRKLECGS